jgi:hypothetical protein
LPDIGVLNYNRCVFSSLQHTSMSCKQLPDAANRTIKAIECTLTVDGYVTLETGQTTIDGTVSAMRQLLSAQGGILTYSGKGFGQSFAVNKPGGLQDIAWGPIPEILELQPLGASRSAIVKWQVKFTIPVTAFRNGPLVQFNEEIAITYDDEAYSTYSIKGTMEIGETRASQNSRAVTTTVDAFRQQFLDQVANTIDLTRFRIQRREFNVSRDKRTMEWEFLAEELPPQGLPWGCPSARGRFTVRPAKTGPGLVQWICSLNYTYTIAKSLPRRGAWFHFATLLQFRMGQGAFGNIAALGNNGADPQQPGPPAPNPVFNFLVNMGAGIAGQPAVGQALVAVGNALQANQANQNNQQRVILIDFGFDEGFALDQKTITFHASWRLMTTYSHILRATGVWRTAGTEGGQNWVTSVRNIQGWTGNLPNSLDPTQDAIVDLQLGAP